MLISTVNYDSVIEASRRFTNLIYQYTAKFPKSENYNITNQVRRSSASITENVKLAERNHQHPVRALLYLTIAIGSGNETFHWVSLSSELHYLPDDETDKLKKEILSILEQLEALSNQDWRC